MDDGQSVYDNPKYYEIAFSFRNVPDEVDLFEACFKQFSLIPVESVLELGCGNSPHMTELIKRGYRYSGLDMSERMLEYSRRKVPAIGTQVSLIQGNMIEFTMEAAVDFVYVMLGSLYVKNTADLTSHLNSVARSLKTGGLYLLDWCVQFDPLGAGGRESWEIERDGISIKTTASWKPVNRTEQTFEETLRLEIDDHGTQSTLTEMSTRRAIYPQEFLLFVSGTEHFEFVGWWNMWDLNQPVDEAEEISRPIALLRRI